MWPRAASEAGEDAEQVRRDVEGRGLPSGQVLTSQVISSHRGGALGHVQEQAEAAPPRAQGAEDVGGAQVAAAVLAQVDALDPLADDEAEGDRAQGEGDEQEEDQQHGVLVSLKVGSTASISVSSV